MVSRGACICRSNNIAKKQAQSQAPNSLLLHILQQTEAPIIVTLQQRQITTGQFGSAVVLLRRLGRNLGPSGVADDYKSAGLLSRAEEGDSSAVQPSRIPSHANPILRDADSKNWQPHRRTEADLVGQANPAYEGLV